MSRWLLLLSTWLSVSAGAADRCPAITQEVEQTRFVPYIADGVVKGYVVMGVKPAGELSHLGLRERDLLIGVQELETNTVERLKAALRRLCDRKLELAVLRSGKAVRWVHPSPQ